MVRGLSHLSHICNPHRRRLRTRRGTPAWAAPRRQARAIGRTLAAALILCATLGGCAGGFESVYSTGLWVEPGKYDFLKCPDIVQRLANTTAAEKVLVDRMARADEEAAGPFINFTVYQAQLQQARGDIALLKQTAREKHCDITQPPPKK